MAERRRHKKRIQVARWSPGTGGDSGVLGRGTTGGDVPSGREAVSAGSRRRDGLEAGRCWRPLGRGGLRSGRVRRRGAARRSNPASGPAFLRRRARACAGREPASSGAPAPSAGLFPALPRVSSDAPDMKAAVTGQEGGLTRGSAVGSLCFPDGRSAGPSPA